MKSRGNTLLKLMALLAFVGLIAAGVYWARTHTGSESQLRFDLLMQQFQAHIQRAHWQWNAEGQPDRILLRLFDEQGREMDRSPVAMSAQGWPEAQSSDSGCERLWQLMMGSAIRFELPRIQSDYHGDADNPGKCYYAFTRGPSFVYDMQNGTVEF